MTALERVRDLLADRPEFQDMPPFDLRRLAAEAVSAVYDSGDGCASCSGCECCDHECDLDFADEHCDCCVAELPTTDPEVAAIIKRYKL